MFKEILGEAFPVIQKFAPIIAGAIGSPAAGVASSFAFNLIASAFGLNPGAKDAGNLILSHPQTEETLTNLENTFSEWFKNNSEQFRMPSSVEINVKLNWSENQSQG